VRRIILSIAAVALLLLMTTAAGADVVGPGGSGTPDALTLPTGSTLLASQSGTYTMSGTGTGTFMDAVYKDGTTGGMDFLFQVSVTTGDISELNANNFANAVLGGLNQADVGYLTTTPAGWATPTAALNPLTDIFGTSGNIDWNDWGKSHGTLIAGQTSDVVAIFTDNPTYNAGFITVQDGGVSFNLPSFQPVPEPASIALFGSGLLGLAGLARRRFLK